MQQTRAPRLVERLLSHVFQATTSASAPSEIAVSHEPSRVYENGRAAEGAKSTCAGAQKTAGHRARREAAARLLPKVINPTRSGLDRAPRRAYGRGRR